jgi:hypothetical protein
MRSEEKTCSFHGHYSGQYCPECEQEFLEDKKNKTSGAGYCNEHGTFYGNFCKSCLIIMQERGHMYGL